MEVRNLEKELNLLPGSVILEYGDSFLAKGIRFFMNILKRKTNSNVSKVYNHVAMFVRPNGYKDMQVGESIAKGYVIRPFVETYYKKRNYIILDPIKPLNQEEQEMFSCECVKLAFKVTRYEFSNFLFQMILIVTGKWYGKRHDKAESRMYCSEAYANRFNKIRPYFPNSYEINPFDILVDDRFKVRNMNKFFKILDDFKTGIQFTDDIEDTTLKYEHHAAKKEAMREALESTE